MDFFCSKWCQIVSVKVPHLTHCFCELN